MSAFARFALLAVGTVLCPMSVAALAEDYPVFLIEFRDGAISPPVVEVPAGTRFKLELRNTGLSPVEFESLELRKEKVLGPGVTSFIVIRSLDPGEYRFFDDFHLDMPPATLLAREPASP
jgi:Cupredoxin-like domain